MGILNRHICAVMSLSALLSGCFLLPQEKVETKRNFENYGSASGTFEKIVPGYTTRQDLEMFGFGPKSAPNVHVLNYLQVAGHLSPLLQGNLPYGIQQCFQARESCQAYVVKMNAISNKRYGNVAADLLAFQRKTRTTGWKMEAMFVLIGDLVVYKSMDGVPEVEEYRKRTNPLGPFQEAGGSLIGR